MFVLTYCVINQFRGEGVSGPRRSLSDIMALYMFKIWMQCKYYFILITHSVCMYTDYRR